jgi:hypothetical protein
VRWKGWHQLLTALVEDIACAVSKTIRAGDPLEAREDTEILRPCTDYTIKLTAVKTCELIGMNGQP